MNSLLQQLVKAAIRIEKKLDELLKMGLAESRAHRGPLVSLEPLGYPNQSACPLCQKQVTYVPTSFPEVNSLELIRVCGCEARTNQLPIQGEDL